MEDKKRNTDIIGAKKEKNGLLPIGMDCIGRYPALIMGLWDEIDEAPINRNADCPTIGRY